MQQKLSFEPIEWELYFDMFQKKEVFQMTKDTKHGFPLFLHGFNCEFKLKKYKQAWQKYKEAEEAFDPYACYRIAELYQRQNKLEVAVNFELCWFYLIKSSVLNHLKYGKDIFNSRQKLNVYMTQLDKEHKNCLILIDKYERRHPKLLKLLFLMQYKTDLDTNQLWFVQALVELQKSLNQQERFYLFEIWILLINVRYALRCKPMQQIVQFAYKNVLLIHNFAIEFEWMISVMLEYQHDNIVVSKMRDQVVELVYVSKILQFAFDRQDKYVIEFQSTLIRILRKLYNNMAKVKILQDRVFIHYYLCQSLYKKNLKDPEALVILKQLQSLVELKSNLGFQGLFYYLKYKLENDIKDLEKALQIYQKEKLGSQNNIVAQYYLAKITEKLGGQAQSYFLETYTNYLQNMNSTNQLTLQTICYFLKIKSKVKRHRTKIEEKPKDRLNYFYPTHKQVIGNLQIQSQLIQFDFSSILILRILKKCETVVYYEALIQQKYCIVEVQSLMTYRQVKQIVEDLQFKKKIISDILLPFIGFASEEIILKNQQYYNFYLVYPPFRMYKPNRFEQKIYGLSRLTKAYNYITYKSTKKQLLISKKYYGQDLVVVGWTKNQSMSSNQSIDQYQIFKEIAKEYQFEFLNRKTKELSNQNLQYFYEEVYYAI